MIAAKGVIDQIYLDERRAARILCPPVLVPAPGQYLLASAKSQPDAALAQPVYSTGICPGGFFAAGPLPDNSHWLPGSTLNLRGPLGRGFDLPVSARKVALASLNGNSGRVLALLEPALAQGASVVLLSDHPPAGLPAALEILPEAALADASAWADYLACQVHREGLQDLINLLTPEHNQNRPISGSIPPRSNRAQVLVETPVPCGGVAECGACAVSLRPGKGFKLACKEGPVFDLYE